ncbi:hypothetical protein [Deinococcus sp. UYEF24]
MANPTPSDVHVDRLMTNFSLMYMLSSGLFAARTVFPTIPVDFQTGLYAVYPKGFFLRNEMKVRPLGGTPEYIDHAIDYKNYTTQEWSTGKKIDDRVRANASDPLGPDRAATIQLTNNALINWEEQWAGKFMKTGVWTNEYAGVTSGPGTGTFLRFNQPGADPIGFVQGLSDSIEGATGYRPNRLTLGTDVYRTLVNSAPLIQRIQYTQRGILTLELLAALFEVDTVNVARGIHNVGKEGQPDNIQRIVDPKSMLLSYADTTGTVTPETVTAGANFAWTGLIPGLTNANGGVITRGRDGEAYSDWMHIRQAIGQEAIAPDLAAYATAVV